MTQEHETNTRLNQVIDLIDDLDGIEFYKLWDHLKHKEIKAEMYEGMIEQRLEEAKSFWADLTIGNDRSAFKEALQEACRHSKAIWAALEQLEKLEAKRRRAEIQAKVQKAIDGGFSFEQICVDGQTFGVEDGEAFYDDDSDIPF